MNVLVNINMVLTKPQAFHLKELLDSDWTSLVDADCEKKEIFSELKLLGLIFEENSWHRLSPVGRLLAGKIK